MNYRRFFVQNSMVFLTIVTSKRRDILINNIDLLKIALKKAIDNYNCHICAICVLPNHIHMIIQPYDIKDYTKFVKQFKTYFSKNFDIENLEDYQLTKSKIDKKECDIWQRRYYEHTIRNENDLNKHIDYIHYNPYKHGYVKSVKDWKYSSFHKFVKNGFYDINWCNYDDKNNINDLQLE